MSQSIQAPSEQEMPDFSDDEHLAFFQNMDQIYAEAPGNVQNYATFAQSLQIGKSITSYIIKNTLKQAEENYIIANIPTNAYQETIALSDLIFLVVDNEAGTEHSNCQVIEDEEPEMIQIDRWWRNRVQLGDQIKPVPDPVVPIKKTAPIPAKRGTIQENKKTELVNMAGPNEDDEYEEKLRTAKLYEIKKKHEIEQKKHEEKQQNQIDKKEGASAKYTFDYDGKILISKPIKIDKLQPTNQKLKPEIRDSLQKADNSAKPQSKQKGAQQIKKLNVNEIEILNKNVAERATTTKEVLGDKAIKPDKSSGFPFETFAMNNGVRLYYEAKVKEGQRHQITDSVEQLANKLSGANLLPGDNAHEQAMQIKLTKTEYKMVTDSAGVFLQQTKTQFVPQTEVNNQKPPQTAELSESQFGATSSALFKKKQQLLVEKNVSFNLIPHKEKEQKLQSSKIELKDRRLIEGLAVQNPTEVTKTNLKAEVPPPEAPKNPVDQFNQTVLTSKDWGKQNLKTAMFPTIKQPKQISESKLHKGTVEQSYKLPRDRVVAQSMRSTSEKFLKKQNASDGFKTFYTTNQKFNEKLRQF